MKMKKSNQTSYATIASDDGDNYREIAEMMTDIGYTMNHSSARNYVLRVMRKFLVAFVKEWNLDVKEENLDKIAKSPEFQQAIADVLRTITKEDNKR